MALNLTYPEIVSSFAGLRGGIEWWNGGSPNKGTIRIGTVKDVDLSPVDPDVHTSDASSYRIELLKINTELSIEGHFWFTNYDFGYALNGLFYLKKRSTGQLKDLRQSSTGQPYVTAFPDGLFSGYYGTDYFYSSPTLLATYKAKLCLVTEYPYQAPTFASGFGIVMLLPTANSMWPASIQSWSHVITNYMGDSSSKFYWQTIPEGSASIYYPFAGAGLNVLWVNDFTYFENYLKEYDPSVKIADIIDTGDADDPVQDNEPSGPGGGGGDWDENSDPVDFPDLPTGGALASGACKAYEMTAANLYTIFQKLWSSSVFDLNDFQKLVDNPMDCIISLHAVPVDPLTSASYSVWIGNFNTEVPGLRIGSQYLSVDCGSLNVKEFWGSALDYNPYTECDIFLPFIGIRKLNTDDVMNNIVHVKYNVDVLNGDCVANVKCGTSVLYKFAGNLKQDIPVTGRASNISMNAIQGGLTALAQGIIGGAVGGPVGAATAIAGGLSAASSVVGSKITTQRSSGLTGNSGILDEFVPYLILHRPIQSLANKFKTFKGYPSNITDSLSNVTGYTEVEFINLQNIPNATSAEMDEIKNLLSKGVLI